MILREMYIEKDSADREHLFFKFDNGEISLGCPIGYPILEALNVFKAFIEGTDELLKSHKHVH